MASRQNITTSWYQDTDWTLQLTIVDSAKAAKDISGWAITAEVQDLTCKVVITMTVGSGITIVDGPAGRADVLFSASDSQPLALGRYNYSIRRTDAGSKTMLILGDITLLGECG